MSTLMKKAMLWSLVLLLIGVAPAAATLSDIVIYDVFGSDGTYGMGISNNGQISGYYLNDGTPYGFLYTPEKGFTTYNAPGAVETSGYKISDAGIVGDVRFSESNSKGFFYDDGFTTFDVPGANATQAHGLNDHGQMVGFYEGADAYTHGFFYNGLGFEILEVLGATATRVQDINNNGQMVGSYSIGEYVYAFMYDGEFHFSGEIGYARHLNGINNLGQFVGTYRETFGGPWDEYGFLFDGVNYYRYLDVPGLTGYTVLTDINDSGRIVGHFYDYELGRYRTFTAVNNPIPPAVWLFGTGLVGLLGLRGWRRKNRGNS